MKYDFEEIYREHFHVVYMYVLGLSGDCKIAEDIAQESFARAIKHINRFRGECCFSAEEMTPKCLGCMA